MLWNWSESPWGVVEVGSGPPSVSLVGSTSSTGTTTGTGDADFRLALGGGGGDGESFLLGCLSPWNLVVGFFLSDILPSFFDVVENNVNNRNAERDRERPLFGPSIPLLPYKIFIYMRAGLNNCTFATNNSMQLKGLADSLLTTDRCISGENSVRRDG